MTKPFEKGRKGWIDGTFLTPSDLAMMASSPPPPRLVAGSLSSVRQHVRAALDHCLPASNGFSRHLRIGTFEFNAALMGATRARAIPLSAERPLWVTLYYA